MLSNEQVTQFFNTGWIVARGLFDATEISRMRRCFEALEREAAKLPGSALHNGASFVLGEKDGERTIKRVVWAGASQPYLLEIGADPRLTVPAAQLLSSRRLEQLLNQAHFKRPNDGVIFGWHQDIQHRDKGNGSWCDVNGTGSFVQTLIAVDDMTPDSGPLTFLPGSCRWGRVDFGAHDYDDPGYRKTLPPEFSEDEVVEITARAGDTLFFGPYTAHASFENTSAQYRRVLINGYAYPGANSRVYPGEGSCRTLKVDGQKTTVEQD